MAAGETPSPFVMQFGRKISGQGPMGYMVEDRHLRAVLHNALEQSTVAIHAGLQKS